MARGSSFEVTCGALALAAYAAAGVRLRAAERLAEGLRSWHVPEGGADGGGGGAAGGSAARATGSKAKRRAAAATAASAAAALADTHSSLHVSPVALPRGFARSAPMFGLLDTAIALLVGGAASALACAVGASLGNRWAWGPLYACAVVAVGACLTLGATLAGNGSGVRPGAAERMAAAAGGTVALPAALALAAAPERLLGFGVERAAAAAPVAFECLAARMHALAGEESGGVVAEALDADAAAEAAAPLRMALAMCGALACGVCVPAAARWARAYALATQPPHWADGFVGAGAMGRTAMHAAFVVPMLAALVWVAPAARDVIAPPELAPYEAFADAPGVSGSSMRARAATRTSRASSRGCAHPSCRAPYQRRACTCRMHTHVSHPCVALLTSNFEPGGTSSRSATRSPRPQRLSESEWELRLRLVRWVQASAALLAALARLFAARPALQGFLDSALVRWYAYRHGGDHSARARATVRLGLEQVNLLANKAALQFVAPAVISVGLAAPLVLWELAPPRVHDDACANAAFALAMPALSFGTMWVNLSWVVSVLVALFATRSGLMGSS